MKVRIPSPLRSYTDQQAWVEGDGDTVDALLRDLDRQFPGMRFRVVDEQGRLRTHMKIWINQDAVRDLSTAVTSSDEITIMQALSGG
ncbi:MAG: MoaD/ThiS family protein [Actinobacteria bacterium]|jgi:sulfur-carrier protein|nr:MAG: MoaD/ThiS family protein [Actinomycetota bacterium]